MLKKLYWPIPAIALASLVGCMTPPTDLNLSLTRPTDEKLYVVELAPPSSPIEINKIHSWKIKVSSPTGTAVSDAKILIGGGMPQHGHGFPTKPRVTRALGDGTYLLEGMKFSMTGWWEIKLDIQSSLGADAITFNKVIEQSTSAGDFAAPSTNASLQARE